MPINGLIRYGFPAVNLASGNTFIMDGASDALVYFFIAPEATDNPEVYIYLRLSGSSIYGKPRVKLYEMVDSENYIQFDTNLLGTMYADRMIIQDEWMRFTLDSPLGSPLTAGGRYALAVYNAAPTPTEGPFYGYVDTALTPTVHSTPISQGMHITSGTSASASGTNKVTNTGKVVGGVVFKTENGVVGNAFPHSEVVVQPSGEWAGLQLKLGADRRPRYFTWMVYGAYEDAFSHIAILQDADFILYRALTTVEQYTRMILLPESMILKARSVIRFLLKSSEELSLFIPTRGYTGAYEDAVDSVSPLDNYCFVTGTGDENGITAVADHNHAFNAGLEFGSGLNQIDPTVTDEIGAQAL